MGASLGGLTASPLISPLTLQTRWPTKNIVGRAVERDVLRQELANVRTAGLGAVTLEGEPGIGKSRLLVALAEQAVADGFLAIAVTADEELQGPFLLARSLFATIVGESSEDAARVAFNRALAAVSGDDDPELDRMAPDQKLLRAYDLGAIAIRTLASRVPVAILIDDAQWADEDSVRLLRYAARAAADTPVLMVLALRPEEGAAAVELGALLADMQRMGLVHRLRLERLTQAESAELLRELLAGKVDATSAATMHAQAEGVPFILEELLRSYREGGLVQQIDGEWRLGKQAERLVPAAVRTLIQRRATHLPEATRTTLAEAAVVGRSFSLKDLQALDARLGRSVSSAELAELLAPAVASGLLLELPEGAAADYRFAHEQVRQFAAGSLTAPRRRELHAAIVELLSGGGDPGPEGLSLLTRHALAAGDTERAARFACDTARATLQAHAPEEVLRIVDEVLPSVDAPLDRVVLLTARDDALEMLRRPVERLESLAQLGALAEALGDRHLLLSTTLRRAAALRLLEDDERAAQLAGQVREQAVEAGDREAELAACLEQGQALLRRPLGESFSPANTAEELDAAAETYEHAAELAEELDDLPHLAAATRELGVIDFARTRLWLIQARKDGVALPYFERIAAGERIEDLILETPVADIVQRAQARFEHAIELFERLGDRRGLMSSIIAMAYIPFALDIHIHGSARRIEEIRRLSTQFVTLSRESERERAAVQMLYGVHVFARAKGVADMALSRGIEAYDASRIVGDQGLTFASAVGVASTYLDLGEVPAAEEWLDRAAAIAADSPLAYRTRTLALLRGICSATAGHADAMRTYLEQAAALAAEEGLSAARCEALGRLAVEAARLGVARSDAELCELAEGVARDVEGMVALLPGMPLWGAQAAAARSSMALQQGDTQTALETARVAVKALMDSHLDDLNFEILLPAARTILALGTEEEQGFVATHLHYTLALVPQRIMDDDVRQRWLDSPFGCELRELAGSVPVVPGKAAAVGLDESETRLLQLLVQGRSNRDMAALLGEDEAAVSRQLARLYGRIGTTSRAQATAFAFRERVV